MTVWPEVGLQSVSHWMYIPLLWRNGASPGWVPAQLQAYQKKTTSSSGHIWRHRPTFCCHSQGAFKFIYSLSTPPTQPSYPTGANKPIVMQSTGGWVWFKVFSLGHALERMAERGGFYWEKWFTELQASSKVKRDRMQRLRNHGDSLQCSLLFIAALRFSMGPTKQMPSTPVSDGKILLFQCKKHNAFSTENTDLLCERNLFPESSISNHNTILQEIHPYTYTRWFKYGRDWFVCKQAALRSSCATLREWSHNLHPPSCSG